MKYSLPLSLLFAASTAREARVVQDADYTMDLKYWIWEDYVQLESTLTQLDGSFGDDYPEPNVEQILVMSGAEIPDSELASLDLTKFEDTAEEGAWFDRVHWTYDTKWNIVYMLDQCRG